MVLRPLGSFLGRAAFPLVLPFTEDHSYPFCVTFQTFVRLTSLHHLIAVGCRVLVHQCSVGAMRIVHNQVHPVLGFVYGAMVATGNWKGSQSRD
jgi:hypothetical protein